MWVKGVLKKKCNDTGVLFCMLGRSAVDLWRTNPITNTQRQLQNCFLIVSKHGKCTISIILTHSYWAILLPCNGSLLKKQNIFHPQALHNHCVHLQVLFRLHIHHLRVWRYVEHFGTRGERVRHRFNENMHVEEVDRALAAVVVVLPAPHVRHAGQQPVVHIGHNLIHTRNKKHKR